MIDHFENLWERSEKTAEKYYDGLDSRVFDIKGVIGELQDGLLNLKSAFKENQNNKIEQIFGKILFDLSFLSQKLNINTYSVLKSIVEDVKIEMLDPDIDNKTA